ncbi:MAG: hypothetical protein IRY99_19115, partial [Isosphaeraceae bacterium]|nr:hypothetical protein [Isosphaeraceae bacterium]
MARPRWKSVLIPAVKLVLGALVLIAVGRHVVRTWHDLHTQGRALRIEVVGIVLGVALYVAGLGAFGTYFGRIVKAGPTPVSSAAALRAYIISHLGKYVPGKAMVVVLRVGLLAPWGARPATTAFAALYETLTMMAAGGLVAAAGFLVESVGAIPIPIPFGGGESVAVPLPWLGLGLGLAFLTVVEPRVFPRLAAMARLPFPGIGSEALPRFSTRLLAEGLLWSLAGWVLWGLSQVAVLRALDPAGLPLRAWPLAIASVALATVAGFVVPIAPGGLGVREWVLWTGLASVSAIDHDEAVVASLALRLTWVLGELLAAAALSVLPPSEPKTWLVYPSPSPRATEV